MKNIYHQKSISFVNVTTKIGTKMNLRKILSLMLFSIILIIALTGASNSLSEIQAASGGCYQVYLPIVIGSGSGGGVPAPADPCDNGGGSGEEVIADFNGDGYADLAIGSPDEGILFNGSNRAEAGAVSVIYGTVSGLSANGNQVWTRADADIYRDPDAYDHFGYALTVGDFDDDGYDDLAVGVPDSYAWPPDQDNAGVVQVIYGSAAGLTADRDELWAQTSNNVPGDAETNDRFGAALSTGDYNYDGYSDLAIGVPGETIDGISGAGAVNVIYGSASGLTTTTYIPHMIHQNLSGVTDQAETTDYFGFALASGDFNSDTIDDLAVGIPDEDIPTPGGNLTDAGAITVFHGAGYGLVDTITNSADDHYWYADSNPYVEGALEEYDRFGHSLAAGDFNNDSYDDLAVGLPSETHGSGGGSILFAGAINVFHGSITGINATASWPARIWHQDSPGMPDEPEFAERFGYSLAAGDFDNDGYEDLAIGIPYEGNGSGNNFGAVQIMYGTSIGLVTAGNDFLVEGPLLSENNDQFGHTLTVDDFNADGYMDLAIGVPNDTPDAVLNTGSVIVRHSNENGLPGNLLQQVWHQGSPGIIGAPESGDAFGASLP
jgi:hypothetical protein